jgi:hypothetical protein
MAGHGESLDKKKGKHGGWMERMKKWVGIAGLGTLLANYTLAAAACVTFAPYVVAAATAGSAYYLYDKGDTKKKGGHH